MILPKTHTEKVRLDSLSSFLRCLPWYKKPTSSLDYFQRHGRTIMQE